MSPASKSAGPRPFHFGPAAVLLAMLAWPGHLPAQIPAPTPPPAARSIILLDPAHGGPDAGARLGTQLLEKDVTLALAGRLKSALQAAGFTVISTRDSDSLAPLTTDQRAEIANRSRAIACIVLHATSTGSGVHLYASALAPKDPPTPGISGARPPFEITPWQTAQAESVASSLELASGLSSALTDAKVSVLAARASVPPIDNMTCPAVAVEVAPLAVPSANATPVSDGAYQQQLVNALTKGLSAWRAKQQAARAAAAASAGGAQ